jgi:polyisoprenyl-phosphate glycosyltransferase
VAETTLSAVITCYKDEPAIPHMHARLSRVFSDLGVGYEIIFVNDASPDGADGVLKELTSRDDRVLAIEHSRNFGSQSAFLSGMQLALGDAVILLDGDLQDPPELIVDFYAQWRAGYDVVYGYRSRREGSFLLRVLARAFYRVFRRVSDIPMPLDAGDFSLMDRKVVDALLALPEKDQFLRGLRTWVGFKQTGVDYLRPARPFGRSTHSFLKNIWWARKGVFSFATVPIEVLSYVASMLTLLSFGALLYQAGSALFEPTTTWSLGHLITAIAFFGSLNLLAVALVGEYVIKILEETKKRPHFIRKSIRYGQQHLDSEEAMSAFLKGRVQGARPSSTAPHHTGPNSAE